MKSDLFRKYIGSLFKSQDMGFYRSVKRERGSVEVEIHEYWDEYIAKGKLPSYGWIVDNVFRKYPYASDLGWTCKQLNIFQFYSEEFIDSLVGTIKGIGAERIVEVGAGDGCLSHFLRMGGIDIITADNYSWPDQDFPESVEKLSHMEALKKYDPDLVVVCWEELYGTYSLDVLDYPSVDRLLWIGEFHDGCSTGCTGSEELWEFDYERADNPYCLARTDSWSVKDVMKHTDVMIFYPTKKMEDESV